MYDPASTYERHSLQEPAKGPCSPLQVVTEEVVQ